MDYKNPNILTPHPTSVALYGDNHIDDLVDSVKEYGILVPLTITDKNMIISGHRRWRSALDLELEQVPVIVKSFPDEIAENRAILDYNRQREKTFSQKMNEANLLKEIYKHEAETRKSATQYGNHGVVDNNRTVEGRTTDLLGAEIGLGKREKFQRAEKIWDKAKEGNKEAVELVKAIDTGEKTVGRAFKELQAAEKRATFVEQRQQLPEGLFDVLYADCPWRYDFSEVSREVEKQYPTMTIPELKDMGLQLEAHIATPAVIFFWATAPKLIEALEVMKAWGFSYRTHAIWDKERIGMGYWFRGQHELLLLGTKGDYPPPTHEARFSSIIKEPRSKHSSKPLQVYDMIEAICPNSRYLELFARSKRKGWESWGNEPE